MSRYTHFGGHSAAEHVAALRKPQTTCSRFEQHKALTKAQLCETKAASCIQAVDHAQQLIMVLLRPQLEHCACKMQHELCSPRTIDSTQKAAIHFAYWLTHEAQAQGLSRGY